MGIFSTFTKILPPPKVMFMSGIGVDISDTSIKYISFKPTLRPQKVRVLDKWGDMDVPEGVLENGEVLDVKGLSGVLKEFKKETEAEFIRVSLPEEQAYVFETEIKQGIPLKEIYGLLEFRLEENVPISARDAIFDYEIIPSLYKEGMSQVVVVAYQRETVLKYHDACLAADLVPLAFEVESQAMARAVISEDYNEVVMLVDFGKTRTGIGIVHQGHLLYTSTIDIGGQKLSEVLRKKLGDVPEKELTNLKNNFGLIRGLEDETIFELLLPAVSVIKDELALRMRYWHQKDNNFSEKRRIKKIILSGGSVNLRGFPEYLKETLKVECERADVWKNSFDTKLVVPPIDRRHSFGYTTAVGLALKSTF